METAASVPLLRDQVSARSDEPVRSRCDPVDGSWLMDRALSRAAGAPSVDGNSVRLLRDAAENYPAWLEAIAAAQSFVYFEAYIMQDDVSGRRFADALIERARAGVTVRLLYDCWAPLARRRRSSGNRCRMPVSKYAASTRSGSPVRSVGCIVIIGKVSLLTELSVSSRDFALAMPGSEIPRAALSPGAILAWKSADRPWRILRVPSVACGPQLVRRYPLRNS